MQKANFHLALIVFFFICACATERKPQSLQSPVIFVEIQNPSSLWIKSSQDREEMIRSNPHHFWSWARHQNWTSLQGLLKFQGQVVGDPHIRNFADVHNPIGLIEFSVVDVDDGGFAPFFLDFIKLAAYVKFVYPEISQQALFRAYKRGLNGEAYPAIEELEQALKIDYANLFKKSLKKVDRKTSHHKFKKDEMELSDFDKLPIEDQKIAGDLSEYLLNQTGVEQILDAGFRVPTVGGSKGRIRFLYLIRISGYSQIVEFKELGIPATAFYQLQKANLDRIRDLSEYYLTVPQAGFAAVRFRERDFWFRKKYLQEFDDGSIEDLDFASISKHLFYLANYLGRIQKNQASAAAYNQELKDKAGFYDKAYAEIVDAYVLEVKRLSGFE